MSSLLVLRFVDHARGSWFHPDDPASDVEEWIDEWVPRLVAEVPSFRFIQDYVQRSGSYEVVSPIAAENFRNFSKLFTMYDHMLTGWTNEDHERFMVPRLLDLERYEGAAQERVERDINAIQSWIDEHPNGVERLLVD